MHFQAHDLVNDCANCRILAERISQMMCGAMRRQVVALKTQFVYAWQIVPTRYPRLVHVKQIKCQLILVRKTPCTLHTSWLTMSATSPPRLLGFSMDNRADLYLSRPIITA